MTQNECQHCTAPTQLSLCPRCQDVAHLQSFDPDEARSLAAALLAAANAAEEAK